MKIVEVTGGLGNQMFQYAFGKYLEKRCPEDTIKYDLSYYTAGNAIREFALKRAFDINLDIASAAEIRKVRGYNPYDNRLRRAFHFAFKGSKEGHEIAENLDRAFDEEYVSCPGDVYYSGYWQCEKYFKDQRDSLVKDFKVDDSAFTASDQKDYLSLLDKICSLQSVAVHIRLEDYLQENNFRVYGNICTADYYKKAIDRILERHPGASFFLFTTEIQKALEILPDEIDITPVSYEGSRDYLDMYLMSRCRHNIIANSTFSWWGAWLGTNPDKTVICPPRWFNNHDVYNQYCEGWIMV